MAHKRSGPLRALATRLLAAVSLVAIVVMVVYLGRSGYRDTTGGSLSLLDASYYAVVTLSTTGYGDITPVSPGARLVNVLIITPARLLFLIILVGTTLEVLTDQYRKSTQINRWRRRVKDHVIVCGYGTKGRSAVGALIEEGIPIERIVIVERERRAAQQAEAAGLTVIEGDAARSTVLEQAQITRAQAVIVAPHADDTAVLITLTARQLTNGRARIIAAARESENAPLLKQSGAHQVIVSASTAGRLLGLSTTAPPVIDVVEDLLSPGEGMALAVRSVTRAELDRPVRSLDDVVIAVVRRGQIVQLAGDKEERLQSGDTLVYVRDDRPATSHES